MESFETENAQFSSELKKIKTSDRVHADVYNERFEKLINNDVALNEKIDRRIEEAENLIGNNIRNNLENVAKESSPKNIENKVIQLENKLNELENKFGKIETDLDGLLEYEKFDLTKAKNVYFKSSRLNLTQNKWVLLLNVNGRGNYIKQFCSLILSLVRLQIRFLNLLIIGWFKL